MGTSANTFGPAQAAQKRPSLLAPGASASEHNILDVVGARKAGVAATSARPPWEIWLLLPLFAAAVWGLGSQWSEPETAPPPKVLAQAKGLPSVETPPAPVSSATQPSALSPPAASPPVVLAAAEAPALAPLAVAAVAPPAAKAAAPNRKLKADKASASASKTNRQPVDKALKTTKKAKAPPQAPALPTVLAAAPQNTSSTKPTVSDPDAELISALLKHQAPDAATAARPMPSIAELVASCQGKNSAQNLACQRRICEGSWGKAQACPMSKAPKSVKVVKAGP